MEQQPEKLDYQFGEGEIPRYLMDRRHRERRRRVMRHLRTAGITIGVLLLAVCVLMLLAFLGAPDLRGAH